MNGGVEMKEKKGSIKIKNNLEESIDIIEKKIVKEVRGEIFGSNNNRKFDEQMNKKK